MKAASPPPPQTVYLNDYLPFTHLVQRVELTFLLSPKSTRVLAKLRMAPNPARPGRNDLRLDGEGLRLIACSVNGKPVAAKPDATGLTLPAKRLPAKAFLLETEVEIAPDSNTALDGLYMSRGLYCTQCEAEGFRKITFYPDRPDVMAPFKVRVESDMPVLLSNGNPVARGNDWAEWDDPWPKPAYLFALVAGDLVAHSADFTTGSGRKVGLNIWVRKGDEDRCHFAMDSLIGAMRWDEEVYGREYDLDVFNIVAVDDFNMGAMENKGLNIFNARYVLASAETATDEDIARIESIIAHEYFHNWTGNRITCRDWFQLCLKEGLTVFRDQQFSGDMRSSAVKRIEDVISLRFRQFREDGGPLAHPVRPESFVEINNFYTATVYEKGAEVIGTLKRLVGDEAYSSALTNYFTRHDGQAATIEDWLKVFEDTTGRDLTQFKLWYSEAGTPRLKFTDDWKDGIYTLRFEQKNPLSGDRKSRPAKLLPIAVGLLNDNGDEMLPTTVLEMTKTRQSFRLKGLASRPIPSILRGFSAPVVLDRVVAQSERAFLLMHDTDPFNKWEAGLSLAKDVMSDMILTGVEPSADWRSALARVVFDDSLDPAFRALALRLPGEDDMAQTLNAAGYVPDPDKINRARRQMKDALATELGPQLAGLIGSLAETGPYSPGAKAAGRRALRLAALALATRLDGGAAAALAFSGATNMTDEIGSLTALLDIGQGQDELQRFATRWAADRTLIDKWFGLQISHAAPEACVILTESLTRHSGFDWKNPNRFRAVIGAMSGNHAGFHHGSGAAYRLLADWLIKLDPINPQTAARMSTAFDSWQRYDAGRQAKIRGALKRILATKGLSRNLAEMAGRMLGSSR